MTIHSSSSINLFLWLSICVFSACAPDPKARFGSENASPTLKNISVTPVREDGLIARNVRIEVQFQSVTAPMLQSEPVVLVSGGVSDEDTQALTQNKPTAALKSRFLPLVTWSTLNESTSKLWVQPAQLLPPGRSTLVVLLNKHSPLFYDLNVATETAAIWPRVWPLAQAKANLNTWTFCDSNMNFSLDILNSFTSEVLLAPLGIKASITGLKNVPCIELKAQQPLPQGLHVAPPVLEELSHILLETTPVNVGTTTDTPLDRRNPTCQETEQAIGSLCVQIEDDRVAFIGDDHTPRLVFGTIGTQRVVAPIQPKSRIVVRGLPVESVVPISLTIRDETGDQPINSTIKTEPLRRHLVVNEALMRPPSKQSSQKFIELVNDSERSTNVEGLVLLDSGNTITLPSMNVAPFGYLLIVSDAFSDEVPQEIPVAIGTPRIKVDSLKLTKEVALLENNKTISHMPLPNTTRTASRGRRHPEIADKDPDAFGFDAQGQATPGRPNQIEKPN